jgi:outer membrane lipoprotein LolB
MPWHMARGLCAPVLLLCLALLPVALTGCAHRVGQAGQTGHEPAPATGSPESSASVGTPPITRQPTRQPPLPARAPSVELQGQMSIKLQAFGQQPAKGLSLGFFFNGHAQEGQLDLMTLLGSQMARVEWRADEAWLINEKGRRRFDSIESLAWEALGEALPLSALIQWMQGHPAPFMPYDAGPDNATFGQLGWHIDTHELAVKKLTAQRPASASQRGVTIKVYLDR